MSTVPKADTPPPANNAKTLTIGDGSGMYARPSAGGGATGDNQGPGPGAIPANPIMGAIQMQPPAGSLSQAYGDAAYMEANAGAPPSAGGTQTGPDVGHGATQIVPQPDATGHPASDAKGFGTVGDSGKGLAQ